MGSLPNEHLWVRSRPFSSRVTGFAEFFVKVPNGHVQKANKSQWGLVKQNFKEFTTLCSFRQGRDLTKDREMVQYFRLVIQDRLENVAQ